MPELKMDKLLELLDVKLDAFAICELERNCGLACPPSDSVFVHIVLDGEGAIECGHGRYPMRPGHVLVVPKNVAKRIEGPSPILNVVDLDEGCSLAMVHPGNRASTDSLAGLVLGCASVEIGMGGVPGFLDALDQPLLQECDGGPLPLMFGALAAELRRPTAGTKQMVEALMKQIFVVMLRSHLGDRPGLSSLHLVAHSPQLGRAMAAIAASPAHPHSVCSLAALAGMSRSCFNRHFSKTYGCSPMEHVQAVRLRAAARMLVGSDLPVKAIATAVGYASRSHLSKAFTDRFGCDPSRYRSSSGLPKPDRESRGPAQPLQRRAVAACGAVRKVGDGAVGGDGSLALVG